MKKKNLYKYIFASLLVTATVAINFVPKVYADTPIQLVIDGDKVTADPEPFIKDDRTLVPIRVVAENLNAEVSWDNDNRIVHISKDGNEIELRIDSHLVEYTNQDGTSYSMLDVVPLIKEDRTFVPIRFISNALGVGIEWDNNKRTVYVDSSVESEVVPFFDVEISSVESGQTIEGTTYLETVMPTQAPKGAAEIKYLLLDRNTARGFVVARGTDLAASYKWMPAMEDNGEKVLVAAFYDAKGNFLAGHAIPVTVDINPDIKLTGLSEGELVTEDRVPLAAELNFSAAYVKYEIINPDTNAYYISSGLDPLGGFTMIPVMEDNGNMALRVIAFDTAGNEYSSKKVNVKVDVARKLSLGGVTEGQTIDKYVSLFVSKNFNVSTAEYVVVDLNTGKETVISNNWFPGPDMAGNKQLYARVKDTNGNIYTSNKITVNVKGTPQVLLQGVGPGQVVSAPVTLKVKSNVTLDSIKYILTNKATGETKIIGEGSYLAEYSYTPETGIEGNYSIKAEAKYQGSTIKTEEVNFSVYTKQLYAAKPIVEKEKFMDFASRLATDAKEVTGMSAALQTAQAILETGWGQSVPVDKYDGQLSNNLFGVKGTGTAGSVTSNTWEEYNGVSFRIDAEFRAYNNVSESWADHNELLLTKSRYQPFRDVMFDSTQGAWALRRCGYATDSQYSVKLINIINLYNLKSLDETTI
ncbi:MAG: stalk domain-containing protein [Sedimentibacter saalensis]|uniref:stalk domain-containing protein n=1 Tax=Sedimentibacter saalensis TaxID=130788 RepID=UPI002B20E0D7|nr:stalk domain-containing protein [Sedimentibacter saalensis]MEA5095540.1 stalk domain-containing protein [Sedimentibacter saalensis]